MVPDSFDAKPLRENALALSRRHLEIVHAFASVLQLVMRPTPWFVELGRRDWSRLAVLCLVTTILTAWQFDRWNPATWTYPTDYSGDAMEMLARIKAASEGELIPFTRQVISRLGAPFGSDWSEYPVPDGFLMFALGQLARLVGVGAAANLAVLLAQLTAAGSFYLCSRWLRQRWEWAFVGALLFSFAFHSVFRGLSHLSLIFTWTVPPAILCCALVARSRRLGSRTPVWYGCVATSAVLAVSNPYNLFMFLQLLGWSLVAQLSGSRRRENLVLGGLCLIVAVGTFAVVLFPSFYLPAPERGLPLLVRNYGGTELYALKPIELLLPPSVHRSDFLASLGDRYVRWSDLRGEAFSPYLGIVGGIGLGWLLLSSALKLFARRRMPDQVLPTCWILAFSAVGGVNNLLAFYLGLQVFRATNRYSIFLSSLVLMFVVGRLTRLSVRWPRKVSLAAAFLVGSFGLWDQLPKVDPRATVAIAAVERDRAFGAVLERELEPESMLFQLPYIDFPEGRPQHQFFEYEHFRPYLATNTIRFTFGTRKHRARSQWQRDFERLPVGQLVETLESAGFAGVYLNRRAYEDGGRALLEDFARHGRSDVIEGAGRQQVVVRLNPSSNARWPIAREPTFGLGWNPPEPGRRNVRWTQGIASFAYFNPQKGSMEVRIRMDVAAISPRAFRLLLNGEEVLRHSADIQPKPIRLKGLQLRPGVNRFDLVPEGKSERQGTERNRLRNLMVQNLSIETDPHPDLLRVDTPRRPERR